MTNGIPLPHPWSVNLASAGRILRDARRARRAGARVVIVNLHWGTEYRHARTRSRRRSRGGCPARARSPRWSASTPTSCSRSGASAALWVVFGEGNLLSNQTAACCPAASQDGMLVRLHLRVGRTARAWSGSPTRRPGCATRTTRSSARGTPSAPRGVERWRWSAAAATFARCPERCCSAPGAAGAPQQPRSPHAPLSQAWKQSACQRHAARGRVRLGPSTHSARVRRPDAARLTLGAAQAGAPTASRGRILRQ